MKKTLLICFTTILFSIIDKNVNANTFANQTDFQQNGYIKASNTDANDLFGNSVSISGNLLVVGSQKEASNSTGINNDEENNVNSGAGAAYVFALNDNQWLQQAYVKASNTDINDGFGFSVAISGNTIVIGAPFEASQATTINGDQDDNSATSAGAVYVFSYINNSWVQQAYLKANNSDGFDNFGYSVAISGNTIVVGAYTEASNASMVNGDGTNNEGFLNGAAYVFHRTDSQWQQQAYLKPTNTDQSDLFGASVAISGDTIIIGAPEEDGDGLNMSNNSISQAGAAYIFKRINSNWSQQAYLKPSNVGENDQFGYAVALSNNTAIVGARFEGSNATGVNGDDNNLSLGSGAAYVFTPTNGVWSQKAYLKPAINIENSFFGSAVAIHNNKIVIGGNNSNDTNEVDLFLYESDAWFYQATLNASNADPGDRFGSSVSISGNLIASGAYRESSDATGVNGSGDNNNAFSSGATYVYKDLENIFNQGFEVD